MAAPQVDPHQGAPLSWPRLLERLAEVVASLEFDGELVRAQDRDLVLGLLASYKASRPDYQQFVSFARDSYTKNLVLELAGGRANVIVMCWAPGQASPVHAHEGSHCFVKVLEGSLLEERVAHPQAARASADAAAAAAVEMSRAQQRPAVMQTNDVTYIDDSIGCHRVKNASAGEPAVTLHVYAPPYRKCRVFELPPAASQSGAGAAAALALGSISMARSRTIEVTFQNVAH